jgi:hypothetical protein
MRLQNIKIGVLFILLAISGGCQKTYLMSKSQAVLYQLEYQNISDFSSLHGFFVDVNGKILVYNSPEKWNFPGEDETITKSNLLENLRYTKVVQDTIPEEELLRFTKYIDNIAASRVTLPKIHPSDSITVSIYCYQYSENSEEYKRTIIKSEGRINCENLNFFSKKVLTWMAEIEKANFTSAEFSKIRFKRPRRNF